MMLAELLILSVPHASPDSLHHGENGSHLLLQSIGSLKQRKLFPVLLSECHSTLIGTLSVADLVVVNKSYNVVASCMIFGVFIKAPASGVIWKLHSSFHDCEENIERCESNREAPKV